jgi:glycine/D-amino acid oxidase-like deaminating enzyme
LGFEYCFLDFYNMYDYIIIGQGLAGTALSYLLQKNEKKILVAEDEGPDAASAVAAGIYNPITGKRMVKTWKAGELFPMLEDFYSGMQKDLDATFLFKRPVYKPFGSIEEQNHWISQTSFADVEDLVNVDIPIERYSSYIHNKYGGFETFRSGYLDVSGMISLFRKQLIKTESYIKKSFRPIDLEFRNDHIVWNGIQSRRIIFCEGHKVTANPFFNWLPFVPAKGELLTVKIKNFEKDTILNKGIFILPVGDDVYKIGATYVWDFKDSHITAEAKEELTLKLEQLIKVPYEIIKQEAGIRPAVKDRRPILGLHPQYQALGIFNGLGTKGVSLAPYFAQIFYDFLENHAEIDKEASIERFKLLYYQLKN